MADTKISAMPDAGALAGAEIIPLVTGGANLSTTPGGGLLTYLNGNLSLAASKITSGTLAVARGGTNIGSYTIGDILYASASGVLSALAGVATGNALISGGVATAPSWGKIGLTTHVSGTLAAANGGTGVANGASSTLTLPNAATTITTGGTLALGGFTLTIPATGTAALLATANNFTATQSIYDSGSALAITLAGAAAGGTVALAASAPAQVASATAGTPLSITASAAIAGSSNAGAAAGGSITLTAGNAARLTSGNAAGGNINLVTGLEIGSGNNGAVSITSNSINSILKFGTGTVGLFQNSSFATLQLFTNGMNNTQSFTFNGSGVVTGGLIGLTGTVSNTNPTADAGIYRNAAAIVEINNGTAGQWGSLKAGTRDAGTTTIVDGVTIGHQSSGTPAAGLGTGLMLNINSSTTADQNALRMTAEWVVATHASRTARAKFNIFDTASREALRLEASGSAAMIGFLGAAAVVRQTAGAATAGVAYTATEQTMLQVVYDALRTFGLTT